MSDPIKQELSQEALAWLRTQTVDCQSCGDVVPAEEWFLHRYSHTMGTRPVLSVAECLERNAAARRALALRPR